MQPYKERYKPIKFPIDEQKHDHIIEWWYFNGNLQTAQGQTFSYMNTLFACKPKKVKIPYLDKIPLKTSYFSHYFLADNKKHQFQSKVNPFCLVNADSFTKPLLWVMYDNACLLEETSLFKYHLINDFMDLQLSSTKKPLLLNKTGFIDLKVKTTYYYSLTSLKTKGIIKVGDKWLEVTGQSWMDHQWAQGPLMRGDKWTWFSVQLNNQTELVCFSYGEKDLIFHASLIDSRNKVKITDNVIIQPLGKQYISQETGSKFFLNYRIYLPDWNIQLWVEPFNKEQEMIFGNINYWEGAIKIKAKIDNQKIDGQGFMELVGSPMKKSALNIYLTRFKKELFSKRLINYKKQFTNKFKAYK